MAQRKKKSPVFLPFATNYDYVNPYTREETRPEKPDEWPIYYMFIEEASLNMFKKALSLAPRKPAPFLVSVEVNDMPLSEDHKPTVIVRFKCACYYDLIHIGSYFTQLLLNGWSISEELLFMREQQREMNKSKSSINK